MLTLILVAAGAAALAFGVWFFWQPFDRLSADFPHLATGVAQFVPCPQVTPVTSPVNLAA